MKRTYMVFAVACIVAFPVQAGDTGISSQQASVLKKLLDMYAAKAKEDAVKESLPAPAAFSAQVGREFYLKRRTWQAQDFTCSGCHTENPTKSGKHIKTGNSIKPLAPATNPERFIDVDKVEKNFTAHCFDLYDRDCRPLEKGNFIAYLMSAK